MKYLRVITVVVITFVFLAALAIGLGVIFAVKNINITIESYTLDDTTAKAQITGYKEEFLDLYKGKLINTISEDDIAQDLADWNCNYTLYSFEKVLPCTINITLLERRETYSYYNEEEDTYYIYDYNGQYLRTADTEEEAMNGGNDESKEDSPNVTLNIPDASYVEVAAALGDSFQNYFGDEVSGAPIRSTVESIYIVEKTSSYSGNDVIFQLRSGIEIMIYDYEDALDEKMALAFKVFSGRDAEDKLVGTIYAYRLKDTDELTSAYESARKATNEIATDNDTP